MQNTANGTSKANQQPSLGIDMFGSNLIVRNLTVRHIYDQGFNTMDAAGANTYDIRVAGGSHNVSFCNNTFTNARYGIASGADGSTTNVPNMNCSANTFATGIHFFLNTVDDNCWAIQLGEASWRFALIAVNVYANSIGPITGAVNWQEPSSSYHPNGIVAFTPPSGGTSVIVWAWKQLHRG